MILFQPRAPVDAWMGFGVAIVYFVGVWIYNRWQERKAAQATS